jgi:glycosyltransferase involved in cell wall biosynthesis
MDPTVSVIMPVHNGEQWLREALDSVLRQDFRDFECIVVDDGSDDGTAGLLDEFARRDDRIRVIHQPRAGIVAALNRAIAAARAPFLARLDADDRARADRLKRQLDFMTAHPDVGLLGSWAEELDQAGARIGHRTPPTEHDVLVQRLARTNPFIHSSVMMRTAMVRALGGYRAAFQAAEDYDLWLRLAEAGRLANLPDDLIQYRWHAANSSRRQAVRQSFSLRLAQRAAAVRRTGAADPAAALVAPPDWWTAAAETSFFAEDVGFYRFLDADDDPGPGALAALRRRLPKLNHTERKLAQQRLWRLLKKAGSPRRLRTLQLVTSIVLLHPGRALMLAFGRDAD